MKKILQVPRVKQLENHCGPACLSMVFSHFGKNYSQQEIVEYWLGREKVSERGTYKGEMVNIAKKVGLNARLKRQMKVKDITNNLDRDNLIIAAIRSSDRGSGHYVIVRGYEKLPFNLGHLLSITDPYHGRRVNTYQDFRNKWGRTQKKKTHYTGIIIGE